jgi:GNAT superfamily N-acetyltransferase
MIKIRKARAGDISQLETLFLITRQHTFKWERPDKFKREDFKKTTIGEKVFVAEDKNKMIVGFISIWEKENPPFIHHLFVSPDHQRNGIGELLIRSLLRWLPLPYRLKCIARNKAALCFYQKNGWVEIEEVVSEEGDYLLLELTKALPKKDK